jgi:PAS domain S-box-containing protein
MKRFAAQARAAIVSRMTATPARAAVTRYALSLGFVAGVFALIPLTPLDGPVGGIIALSSVVACCWFSGVGPALLMPLIVWLTSQLHSDDPTPVPSSRELMTFIGLSMLTGAMGLAGGFWRRLRTATLEHDAIMREQTRALSAARIVFRDLDGRITKWNEGAVQLYGWTREEATDRVIHELLRTETPLPLDEIRGKLLLDGQWRGEVVQRHKGGHPLNIVVHAILYSGDGAGRIGVAEVHTDVTELRRAEARIRESDRRKDLFVATLAHELRNPLAPLRTGIEILRMRLSESPDDIAVLETMRRQLEHMVRMVDDLLDVSRINTGRVELRRSRVMLSDVVRDAVAACQPQIQSASQHLTVTIPEAAVLLDADGARLVQVLMNLLGNASKFTDARGEISLNAVREEDQVVIRVRDNGAGVPADALPHIFDLFSQVEDPLRKSRDGLGLGLSIVRTIVELHGGTVEGRSEGPGQGSEFVVRLPVIDVSQPCPTVDPSEGKDHQNGHPASRRVLIVDDNRDAARMMSVMLSMAGFTCHSVFDGPSALRAAVEFDPHVVVLDLGMPGMDGLEVARRLRAEDRYNAVLLVAVTGWDKEEDRRLTQEAGFDHHLAKPVSFEKLQRLFGLPSRNDRLSPATSSGAASGASRCLPKATDPARR